MGDIMSILQSSYTSASSAQSLIAPGSKFANVDPTKWAGTWTGTDDKKQPVTISITKVSGFRANVTVNDARMVSLASETARDLFGERRDVSPPVGQLRGRRRDPP